MSAADTPKARSWAQAMICRARPAILALSALAALAGPAAVAAPKAPRTPPVEALASAPPPANVDDAKLTAALKAFEAPQGGLGVTQAVLILHNGAIVLERYAPSVSEEARLNSWNIGSAITSVLAGRAVQTGAVKSLDEPAGLTEWTIAGDGRRAITLRNLLAMNAGLKWRERHAGSPAGSDAEKMLFGKGQMDVLAYAAAPKAQDAPGAHFVYSTGSSVLLGAALQRRLPPLTLADGKRTYAMRKFITTEVFDKIGMTGASPQFDIDGNYYSSLLWATPRDLARFGQFCLQDGLWNKERLLPEGWIQAMRAPSGAKGGESYGAGFWIKAKDKPDPLMAHLPDDSFAAGGDRGAVIVMIPSKDLVIVRLGITPWGEKPRAALGAWLGEVAAAFP